MVQSSIIPQPSNNSHKIICHSLPCHIDYNGHAPIDIYFRPTDVRFEQQPSNNNMKQMNQQMKDDVTKNDDDHKNNDEHNINNNSSSQYQAATFRGRGLLARKNALDILKVDGRVIEVGNIISCTNNNDPNENHNSIITEQQPLKEISRFNEFMEWHHEHNFNVLHKTSQKHNLDNDRLQRAIDWIEISSVLHESIPIEE